MRFIDIVTDTTPLIPLLILIVIVLYIRGRRIYTVSDAHSIKKLVETDKIQAYNKIYVTPKVLQKVEMMVPEGILEPRELDTDETKRAERLAFDYGVNVDIAELLILCDKVRAKEFLTKTELPDELIREYKKLNIRTVE